jgi:hypothetical protein
VSKDMLVNGAFNFHSAINHYALSKCYKYTPGKKKKNLVLHTFNNFAEGNKLWAS